MPLVRSQILHPVLNGVVDVRRESVRLKIFFEGVHVRALSSASDGGEEFHRVFLDGNWAFFFAVAGVSLRGLLTLWRKS